MLGRISDRMSQYMPERMSDRMSKYMPERRSDRMYNLNRSK